MRAAGQLVLLGTWLCGLLALPVVHSSLQLNKDGRVVGAAVHLTESDAVTKVGLRQAQIGCSNVAVIRALGVADQRLSNRLLHAPASLKSLLLPVGYPQSVPREYMRFQLLNCLQDACSYLRGVMSTSAILKGMGVGDVAATATTATIMWFLRDFAGMVGGLLFASLTSLNFGQNAKQWRLFADAINNVGITLEVLAPSFSPRHPSIFVLFLSAASVCRALCGVAAGATGAAFSEHWGSRMGNFADVSSKNQAQHTVISLVCLSASIPFIRLTGTASSAVTWAVYGTLTFIHMSANIAAMRVLALRSLNSNRLSILISRFLRSSANVVADLTTSSIAKADSLLLGSRPADAGPVAGISITYWTSLKHLTASCSPETIAACVELYAECNYLLAPSRDGKTVLVLIKDAACAGTGTVDQAKALFEAHMLRLGMAEAETVGLVPEQLVLQCRSRVEASWSGFWLSITNNGWDTTRLLLQPSGAATISVA